jgi:hypothetical protein
LVIGRFFFEALSPLSKASLVDLFKLSLEDFTAADGELGWECKDFRKEKVRDFGIICIFLGVTGVRASEDVVLEVTDAVTEIGVDAWCIVFGVSGRGTGDNKEDCDFRKLVKLVKLLNEWELAFMSLKAFRL